MTKHNNTHLLSLALAFGLVALPAMAQDAKEPQTTGSVTVGAQTGSGLDTSSKLQQYEIVPKGVSLFDVNIDWKNNANYFMTFQGNKLGLDDQYASFQAGHQGAWKLDMSLNQNPRWFSNVAETLYSQSSPGVFTLPAGMRQSQQQIWSPASGETAAPANSSDNRFWSMRDYMNGAQPVDLRYVRKTGLVGFDLTALENWTFKVSYQREMRDGSQPVAFTAGPGIDEIANPIQYTTQDSRAEVEFAKNNFFLNGAFTHSTFANAVPYTTVDNPVRLYNTDYFWGASQVVNTSANATARLWNAPDNTANSFDFTAGYKLPSHHKVTFTGSSTVMTMAQDLIPQATNPSLNLATTSADYGKFTLAPEYPSVAGRLEQSLYMANFSGDPTPMFGYSAFYRTFDLKDKKDTYTFHSTSNSDGGASYSATGITTGNAGFKNNQFKVEGHVTPFPGLRFGLNGGQTKNTYDERDYLDNKDTTFGVTLDVNRNWAMLHGAYSTVNRKPGTANPAALVPGVTGNALDPNAEMKDMAKQDSKLYNAALTLTPIDSTVFTFYVQGVNSDFPETSIGLKKSKVDNYGFDVTYAVTDKFSLNAGYIYEKIHMDTNLWYGANGSPVTPANTTVDQYWNKIDDKVDTYNVGFRWTLVPSRMDVGSDYDYAKGRSDSGFTINAGGQAGGDMFFPTNTTTVNFTQMQYLTYPQVYNATTIWKTWFNYHVDKNVTLSLMYWHQKFDQADWAYDNLGLYMLPGSALYATTAGAVTNLYPQLDPSANRALFLGARVPNYNANILRASLSVRF